MVNTERREQLLRNGTDLGIVEEAEVIEPRSDSSDDEVRENSAERSEVVEKIMNGLPAELTESQRCDIFQLLHEYESIFSKGQCDTGRTPLVEQGRCHGGGFRRARAPPPSGRVCCPVGEFRHFCRGDLSVCTANVRVQSSSVAFTVQIPQRCELTGLLTKRPWMVLYFSSPQ